MNEKQHVCVEGFLPSRNGFCFSNDFPCGPVVTMCLPGIPQLCFGNASCGLCGGMSFAARDYFDENLPIPDNDTHPASGSQLFDYLARRLWDSFRLPGGPFRYYTWMRLSDEAILQRTLKEGWPRVRDELDRGNLSALGFNRYRSSNPMNLGHNHQVLAYGYDGDPETSRVDLHIYDPDYSGRDDIILTFHLSGPEKSKGIVNSTGEPVRGFFHTVYKPPGFAWLSYLFGLHH